MTDASPLLAATPPHVPHSRFVDIDLYDVPGARSDVHLAWRKLAQNHDLVWSPHHGGHWIAVGGDLVARMYRDIENFSNCEIGLPPKAHVIPMLPIMADGDAHRQYRALIEPAFKPSAIEAYTVVARDLTIKLIEGFLPRGRCDFIADYGLIVPLTIFLSIVNLPLEDREELHGYAETMTRSNDIPKRHAAYGSVISYLTKWIALRKEDPGVDLLSKVVTAEFQGVAATQQEILGISALLLFGGLDTVTSMMSFVMRFLAANPAHRQWILDHPNRIAFAIEELMRRHGVGNNMRTAINDVELDGVMVRAGDLILVCSALHGLDERLFVDALTVNFERPAKIAATFGFGPHRCPGSTLARMEIRIMVEEWLRLIPNFEIDPEGTVIQASGGVNGILRLPLRWHPGAQLAA